jgi:hypothetical protein
MLGACKGQVHLQPAARKLARYKLDLVGVQEVSWGKRDTVRAVNYIFYGKAHENHQLGKKMFAPQNRISS